MINKWVKGNYDGKRVIGFVTDQGPNKSKIQVTQPFKECEIFIYTDELNTFEDSTPDVEGLKILIDLALMLNQKEWFYELCKQLEEWKKIEEVKEVI